MPFFTSAKLPFIQLSPSHRDLLLGSLRCPKPEALGSQSPHTWLSFLITLWAASVLVLRLRARPSISSASFSWRFWCRCRTRSSSAADCFSSLGVGPDAPLTPQMGRPVGMRSGSGKEGRDQHVFKGPRGYSSSYCAAWGCFSFFALASGKSILRSGCSLLLLALLLSL